MLLHDFFSFSEVLASESERQIQLRTAVALNKNHQIFQGHFPGQPVMPGVCMLQIVKEIIQAHLQKKILLTTSDNIKFLAVVNPEIHAHLDAEVKFKLCDGDGYEVEGKLFAGDIIFFKMKASFKNA